MVIVTFDIQEFCAVNVLPTFQVYLHKPKKLGDVNLRKNSGPSVNLHFGKEK